MNAGVRDGELRREDLVWCEGMPDWQPAGDVLPPFRASKDISLAHEGSMALWPKKSKPEEAPPPKATNATAAAKPPVKAEAPKQLSAEEMKKMEAASARLLFMLGKVVSVLMRAPEFRSASLGDIQALVVPPLMAGQILIAEARSKSQGFATPAATALWAKVSKEVDERLSKNLDKPIQLAPNEWTSGEIAWLVALAGHPQAIAPLLGKLQQTTLKGQPLKMRSKGKDGKPVVTTFSAPTGPGRR
jgi:hemolysin-activating ACP:hemolysin acyltransferase